MQTLSSPRSRLAAGALVLALAVAGCGQEGQSGGGGGGGSTPPGAAGTLAASMTLGAGPDCSERPFCQIGLRDTYGLNFKAVKAYDEPGGTQTKTGLDKGEIDVGLVFTSDGDIAAKGWVLLEDDKKLQPSDNVTPVVNKSVADAYGADLQKVVDDASAKITTADLVALNKSVTTDKKDADAVAKDYVKSKSLAPATAAATKDGPEIVVGSAAFGESEILANVYNEVLKANGYKTSTNLRIGSREVYYPALERGEVTFLPEYAGTLLQYLDKNAKPSTESSATSASLTKALEGKSIVAYKSAPAEDKNGFVVTRATADKYGLTKLSDLAKQATK
jgi:osmoprotectant transport system substrate-binding protein